MSRIEVRVKHDGTITIDVDGVMGASCTDLTSHLISRLGGATETRLKPEYYAEEKIPQFEEEWS